MDLEWTGQTQLDPLGVMALIVLAILTLSVPRRYAALPLIVLTCAIPAGQRLVLLGTDWTLVRILVLAGLARIVMRSETKGLETVSLDRYVVALPVVVLVASTLRTLSFDYFVRYLGVAFDSVGTYVLFRCWIRSWRDVGIVARGLVVLSIPIAIAFGYENATGRNPFARFGGVPEITLERQGKMRSQGPFSHPIIAGAFWASLIPLFMALVGQRRRSSGRPWGLVGLAGAVTCILFAASSTPYLGAAAGMVAMGCFAIRDRMREVRWAIVGTLFLLQLMMDNPIWHLISRIDLVGGSTGYHRFVLIDNAVRRFPEWFLVGTSSTIHWGHGMRDVTNEYVMQGVRGGFAALVLFIVILVIGYKSVGRLWRAHRRDRDRLLLSWSLGACLFSHTIQFLGVTYFGQILVLWALLLGAIGSLAPARTAKRVRSARPARSLARVESAHESRHPGAPEPPRPRASRSRPRAK